jgi:ankyrin repeat protein
MAGMLVYAGAHLEAVTRLGAYTPLLAAARAGRTASLLQLLEAGARPVARTSTGVTALHFAAAAGSAEAVAALLARGADPDARERAADQTPLMFAAAAGRADAIRALLAGGADAEAVSRVVDVAALEESDAADARRREERLAALRALDAAPEAPADADSAMAGAGPDDAPPDSTAGAPAPADSSATAPDAPAERADSAGRGGGGPRTAAEVRDTATVPQGRSEDDEEDPLTYGELVGGQGGLTPLLLAARGGHVQAVRALLEAGADVDRTAGGDGTSPLLIATMNGHFDLGLELLAAGADPTLASDAGATPLYAALNVQWAPKALYPQPRAHTQQRASYLDYMTALLQAGADPNARLTRHLWYMSYNFDLLGVDTQGATPFWRAAYATDVQAMRLLVAHGADPEIPTTKPAERRRQGRRGSGEEPEEDPSGLPEIPVGGPGVYPIHAASGVGYGKDFAANAHRHVPDGWLPAVRYLVEELGADPDARDHEGNNAVHHAASRGDEALILYLVEKGADVTAINRKGQTTADMANGPVQRVQPFPATVALLEKLGSANNHTCLSC